jgi:predicted nucleic acid-binding protein
MGLAHTGTLGVFLRSAKEGYIARVGDLLDELDSLGFRVAAGTRAAVLRIAGE